MRDEQWRSVMANAITVDMLSETVTLDNCLMAVWDYIAIKMAERADNGGTEENMSRTEVDNMRKGFISEFIREKCPKVDGYITKNNELELKRLYEALAASIVGYDILEDLMNDPTVNEIQINSESSIRAERNGKLEIARDSYTGEPLKFRSIEACQSFINNLLGTTGSIDKGVNKCIGNSITPEGYRVAAIGSAAMAADKGRAYKQEKAPACVIRKFSDRVITTDQLVGWGAMSDEMAHFTETLGLNHASVIVGGETGAGKTVNLQAVIDAISDNTRVFSLEKDSELRLRRYDADGNLKNNVVQLEYVKADPGRQYSQTSNLAKHLFNQALRFTPRTIVMGECRDEEEISLLMTAANAGHNVMCTLHTDAVAACIERMTTALMQASPGQQKPDVMNSICTAIDIVVIPSQMADGTRKVLEIGEVIGCEVVNGICKPIINMLYEFQSEGYDEKTDRVYGQHVKLNPISSALLKKWSRKGMTRDMYKFLSEPVPAGEVIPGKYNGAEWKYARFE